MRTLILLVALCLPVLAQADYVPFSASMAGDSNIVEFIDPTVPIVRVETATGGSGSFGVVGYFSEDIVNLATGAGAGVNRFVDADGDELFGSFTVQLIPLPDAGSFDLIGEMFFTGGTGSFSGASGNATFTGRGVFDSPTHALSNFRFDGRLALVPEPSTGLLLILAGGMFWAQLRRRTGSSRGSPA